MTGCSWIERCWNPTGEQWFFGWDGSSPWCWQGSSVLQWYGKREVCTLLALVTVKLDSCPLMIVFLFIGFPLKFGLVCVMNFLSHLLSLCQMYWICYIPLLFSWRLFHSLPNTNFDVINISETISRNRFWMSGSNWGIKTACCLQITSSEGLEKQFKNGINLQPDMLNLEDVVCSRQLLCCINILLKELWRLTPKESMPI